jgi:hypothetical protein
MYERLRASDRATPFSAAVHMADAPIELREGILRCLSIAPDLVFQLTNPSSLLRVLRALPCALWLLVIDPSHLDSLREDNAFAPNLCVVVVSTPQN